MYAEIKGAFQSIKERGLIFQVAEGLDYSEELKSDFPFVDVEVLMECLNNNFHADEYYDPEDCAVQHAIDWSLREYCMRMSIGVECSKCGKVDNHQNDISEVHLQIGRFVEQWGRVEVTMRTLEMMRNEDGTYSARHYGGQNAKGKRRKFHERRDLLFPQENHAWIWQTLKDWAEFRNALTHNVLVKDCDGSFRMVHFDEIARRRSQHEWDCDTPLAMNSISDIPPLNKYTLALMSNRMAYVLCTFRALISRIQNAGPCSKFEIGAIWEQENIKIMLIRSCEHEDEEQIILEYDHGTHHIVENYERYARVIGCVSFSCPPRETDLHLSLLPSIACTTGRPQAFTT